MVQIKNLKKASQRIKKAIKNKEKIILYPDSDMDGVTSVILLKEAIKNLGGEISAIYFPNIETEGYGISKKAISLLKNKAPGLFITLDCGITNFKEAELLKKIGFEVMIIDHHEVLDKLPNAEIIVNPKQKGDKYPFKELANVGIVLKLTELLMGKNFSKSLKNSFLELAALGTLADMMPHKHDNKEIIVKGMKLLQDSWWPAIRVFFENQKEDQNIFQKVFKLISILNSRDIKSKLPVDYQYLTISHLEKAKKMLLVLMKRNLEKKKRTQEIKERIEQKIIKKKKEVIIFESCLKKDFIFLGKIASILTEKYQKPVFLYVKNSKGKIFGSVRAPKNYNIVEAFKKCSKLLKDFGGHPRAAGFRMKTKNLKTFKKCLIEHFLN